MATEEALNPSDKPAAFQGEAAYRLLFDRNPWPMWVYDAQTLHFLAVNEAAVASYGYSEAEFLRMSLPDIRPEDEHAQLTAYLAAPESQRHSGLNWRHRRRSGELIWVQIVSEAIEFAGRPARLVLAQDVTQRLRAEHDLRLSERRYRDIVETATEGIWAIDAQARTSFVNPKMAQMLGYSVDEMAGRPLTDFMDAQGAEIAKANLERRRQGVAEQHDFKFQRKDGGELWASIATNPVLDEAGAYAGALAMVTDITERRRNDQQLKLLASSVARFNDIVLITEAEPQDEPGPRILFVNEAFERRTGYTRDEVLGRSPRFLQGPRTDKAELRRIGEALRRWEPVRSELINCTKRGEEFWVELDMLPIADSTGSFTHWVAVQHDITARKRAQARDASRARVMALMADGAPLPLVFEAIVEGIASTQHDTQCSVQLLDASGALPPHGAAPGPPASWSAPILSHSGVVLGAFDVHHRDGRSPSAAEVAAVAEATKVAAVAIERKRADAALRESQKMEALGTLAGGIAHDFNNILGAILGNLALVRQEGGVTAVAAAQLAQVNQSALRARDLVHQILAFSRQQAHLAVSQPLRPLVSRALDHLRAMLPTGERLSACLTDDELNGEVDANQMQQVLVNLCTNAWHATSSDGGSIEVGLEALTVGINGTRRTEPLAPGRWAHLWVRDTGSGMDEATRARIFEPFFTTKPVGRGTGLGLAVVHGIVTEHRGLISVDTAVGLGSTIHIYLPATEAARAPVPPPLAAAEAAPPTEGVAPNILLVDDDAVMLLTGTALLRGLGYRVAAVGGGREALDAVRDRTPGFDLVVCDHNMPDCSGIDVARSLAASHAGLPVVIYSGYIDAELQARASALGVRALVQKENSVEELGATIRRVLAEPLR